MAKAKSPDSVPTTAPLSRLMNVSPEAAAAAARGSANPDIGFLTDLVAELGIGKQLSVPAAPTPAPSAEATAEAAPAPEPQAEAAPAPEPQADPAAAPAAPEGEQTAEPSAQPAADPLAEIKTAFDSKLAALQQELAALRERPSAAPVATEAPRAVAPVVRLEDRVLLADSPETLDTLSEEYGALADRCLENPDGFELAPTRPGEVPRSIGPEEVRRLLVDSNRVLRQIPIRARELTAAQSHEAQAVELYPGFNDPTSLESKTYSALVSLAPQLRRLPNLRTFIGDAVAHEKARRSGAAPAASPAAIPAKLGPTGKPLPGQPVARAATPPAVPPPPARAPASAAATTVAKKQELFRRQASGQGGTDNLIALVDELLPRSGARRAG